MTIIDFERACLAWTTKSGSVGRWRVIAAATDAAGDQFVLAPMVMAGDVYGAGRLPLDPPYSFQICASSAAAYDPARLHDAPTLPSPACGRG